MLWIVLTVKHYNQVILLLAVKYYNYLMLLFVVAAGVCGCSRVRGVSSIGIIDRCENRS